MGRFDARSRGRKTRAVIIAAISCLAMLTVSPARAQMPPVGEVPAGGDETLFQAAFSRTSDDPLELRLVRIALDPGGSSPRHTHPGLEFGVVEEGSLVVRVNGAALRRSSELGDDGESQVLPEGVDVTISAGDRIAYAPETEMTFRNPGPGRAMLLAATVLPTGDDAPAGAFFPDGTPTVADVAGVQSRILGVAVVDDLPEGRLAIALERLVTASGEVVPGFPGPVLVAVEAGGLSGAVLDGAVELPTPAATSGDEDDGTSGEGSSFDLGPGEALFFPAGMAETPPLGGEGSVVLLRLGIVAAPEEIRPTATPTATPSPSATATTTVAADELAPGTIVVVLDDETRLRGGPSLDALVLNGFEAGRRLVITGDPVEGPEYLWYPVADPDDPAIEGYVAGELLGLESSR